MYFWKKQYLQYTSQYNNSIGSSSYTYFLHTDEEKPTQASSKVLIAFPNPILRQLRISVGVFFHLDSLQEFLV